MRVIIRFCLPFFNTNIIVDKNTSKINGNGNIVEQGKENILITDIKRPLIKKRKPFYKSKKFWFSLLAVIGTLFSLLVKFCK